MPYIENLKDKRIPLGLSQARLAGKAGVDRMTVSRCENGYFVQEVSCFKIATALTSSGYKGKVTITEGGIMGEMPKKGSKTNSE